MEQTEIKQRIDNILIDHLELEPDEVKPEADIIDDLDADSIDTVELIMKLESEFGITIPDEDVDSIRTVGNLYKYIQEKTKGQLF